LGLSLQHSSEVPLVFNLQTGSIDTQYHVVFDDQFTTVSLIEREMDPPSHWGDLYLESAVRIVTDHPETYLKDDWLTEEELEEKRRDLQREKTIREATLQRINQQPHEARLQREKSPQTELKPEKTKIGFPNSVTFEPAIIQGHQDNITPRTIIQGHQEDITPIMSNLNPLQPKVEPSSTEGKTGLRRSTRLRKEPERYMNGYLATVMDNFQNYGYECAMSYKAELQTDNDKGLVDIQYPIVYAAKKKKTYDEDCPNLFQAMNREFAEQYLEAMKKEIQTLITQKTHDPRASHAVAIKRILRYIKGTKDKGIYFKSDGTDKIDCCVDSDFAGLFSVEDKQQPISAKSRTGYVILYSGVPILWVSKMQNQIALSTMEA
jgi:hypothetical protein